MAQAVASSLVGNENSSTEAIASNETTPPADSQPNVEANEEPQMAVGEEAKQVGESNGSATTQNKTEEGAVMESEISALASFAGVAENAAQASLATEVAGLAPVTLPLFTGNVYLPFTSPPVAISPGEVQWEQLLAGSTLVFLTDRNLVPDSLFVAMAQMEPCKLSELDRCGAYKNRDIGFTGLKCKYCHGQPGFGRYFPASVRSLAQTTTSQTIIKHIGQRCQFCPDYVRATVVELERQLEETAKSTEKTKKPHGGRKLFFERLWTRLHGESALEVKTETAGAAQEKTAGAAQEKLVPAAESEEKASKADSDKGKVEKVKQDAVEAIGTSQAGSDKNDEGEKLDNDEASNDEKKGHEVSYPLKKRKYLFRSLPTQKRKTRSDTS